MRVKMLEDAPGSPDGVTVNEYEQDEVYNVPDELGAVFLAEGYAEDIGSDVPSVTSDPEVEPDGVDTGRLTKKVSGPSENKGS